jgi:hypothetical protein
MERPRDPERRASIRDRDQGRLRWLSGLVGLGLVVTWTWCVLPSRPSLRLLDLAVPAIGVVAFILALFPRLPRAVLAWSTFFLALGAWLLCAWSYTVVSFPFVDVIRPWGMDKGPFPVVRPMFGLLLLLFALAVIRPERIVVGGVRGLLKGIGVVGCLVLLGFWSVPRWFEIDVITSEALQLDAPDWVPRPGRVGEGESPAVVGGTLQHLHWTQYAFKRAPALTVHALVVREQALSSLAWGMQWELDEVKGKADSGLAHFRALARRVLWTIQRAISAANVYLQVASLPAWLCLLVCFARRRPLRLRVARVVEGLLLVQTLGVFLVNTFLVAATLICFLPEGTSKAWIAGLQSLGMVAVCLGIRQAGRVLAFPGTPRDSADAH